MGKRKVTRETQAKGARAEAARKELVAALQLVADQPAGKEALEEMAIKMILPIEKRVRRENPDHPTLALIDERRRTGRL